MFFSGQHHYRIVCWVVSTRCAWESVIPFSARCCHQSKWNGVGWEIGLIIAIESLLLHIEIVDDKNVCISKDIWLFLSVASTSMAGCIEIEQKKIHHKFNRNRSLHRTKPVGLEPTRNKPNWFLVNRLNKAPNKKVSSMCNHPGEISETEVKLTRHLLFSFIMQPQPQDSLDDLQSHVKDWDLGTKEQIIPARCRS